MYITAKRYITDFTLFSCILFVLKTCTTLCNNCLMPLTGTNCVIAWVNNYMYHNHLFFIKTTGSTVFYVRFPLTWVQYIRYGHKPVSCQSAMPYIHFVPCAQRLLTHWPQGCFPSTMQSHMTFYNMNICTYHKCFVGDAKICTQFHTKNAVPLPWVSTQLVNQGRKQAVENITATSHEGKGVSNKRKFACLLKSLCWLT